MLTFKDIARHWIERHGEQAVEALRRASRGRSDSEKEVFRQIEIATAAELAIDNKVSRRQEKV